MWYGTLKRMKLTELEPRWMKYEDDGKVLRQVETLAEADGIWFLCPKCFAANNGPIGTHSVGCWFTGKVPDSAEPGPGRWNPSGTSFEDLTFVPPGAVSVKLTSGCQWHGFIRNGEATLS